MAAVVRLTDSQMAVAIKEAERRMESGRNQTDRTFTGRTLTEEYKKQIVSLAAQLAYFEMYGLLDKSEEIFDFLIENIGLNFYFENFSLIS